MSKVNNNKKTRKSYSAAEKEAVLEYKKNNKYTRVQELSERFGMPIGTFSNILKKENKYLHNSRTKKKLHGKKQTEIIEEPLFNWFVNQKYLNKSVKNSDLTQQARLISTSKNMVNFKASNTWIKNFKKRFGIVARSICGEEGLVDE